MVDGPNPGDAPLTPPERHTDEDPLAWIRNDYRVGYEEFKAVHGSDAERNALLIALTIATATEQIRPERRARRLQDGQPIEANGIEFQVLAVLMLDEMLNQPEGSRRAGRGDPWRKGLDMVSWAGFEKIKADRRVQKAEQAGLRVTKESADNDGREVLNAIARYLFFERSGIALDTPESREMFLSRKKDLVRIIEFSHGLSWQVARDLYTAYVDKHVEDVVAALESQRDELDPLSALLIDFAARDWEQDEIMSIRISNLDEEG
jgi:hypothetical protein